MYQHIYCVPIIVSLIVSVCTLDQVILFLDSYHYLINANIQFLRIERERGGNCGKGERQTPYLMYYELTKFGHNKRTFVQTLSIYSLFMRTGLSFLYNIDNI